MARPVFPHRVLFCLEEDNVFRAACCKLVSWKPFEWIILTAIFANSICLAASTPLPNGDSSFVNDIIEKLEYFFIALFISECIVKIIAYGLILHPGAYLRSGLNVLDFLIVLVGLISLVVPLFITGQNHIDVKALRAFRFLRPVRFLSGTPSLQMVLNSIIRSMVPLAHIALLVVLMVTAYAIVGVELFGGVLHKACASNVSGEWIMVDEPTPCGGAEDICDATKMEFCQEVDWDGPNNGITGFDNFGTAMMTVFQCLTLEGWTNVLYNINDAVGNSWPWIYFVSMVVIGSFFILNLVLGVLTGMFSKERAKTVTTGPRKKRNLTASQVALEGYLDWISKGEAVMIQDDMDNGTVDLRKVTVKFSDTVTCRRLMDLFTRFQQSLRGTTDSKPFFWLMMTFVFLNALLLASEHHGQPEWLSDLQGTGNLLFITIFVVEFLLKLTAAGFSGYFKNYFHRFEFFVAVTSVLECILVRTFAIYPFGMAAFRTARLMKVFKVTSYWTGLRNMTLSFVDSVRSIASLLLLLFLFIFIFSLLGMQLFGGKFNLAKNEEPMRNNFDSFWQSLLTVFQILTGEDWWMPMHRAIQAYGGIHSGGFVSAYFIAVLVGGKYILLNVFLAIAVDNLDDFVTETKAAEEKSVGNIPKIEIMVEHVEQEIGGYNSPERINPAKMFPSSNASMQNFLPVPVVFQDCTTEPASKSLQPEISNMDLDDIAELTNERSRVSDVLKWKERVTKQVKPLPDHKTFFIFTPENRFRLLCYRVCISPIFRSLVLSCILASSALLAAADPVNEFSARAHLLEQVDYAFTALFVLEIAMKCVAYGFLLHPSAVCRSRFDLLDMAVVSLSILSYTLTNVHFSAIKALRVFRVLRPLVAINRAKGLKRVVRCAVVSVKTIWIIIVMTFLVQFMFAIVGVQIFRGRFARCTDIAKSTPEDCQGQFFEYSEDGPVEIKNREWINSNFHFDDLPNAMLTLMTVSTSEGWPDYAYIAIDSNEINHGPIFNHRPWAAIFFVVYIIVVGFFMMDICVGFIIVTFEDEGEQDFVQYNLDKNQRSCLEFALHAKPFRRFIPSNRFQYKVWNLVTSEPFELFVFGLILLNTALLGAKFYGETENYSVSLDYLNLIFTQFFLIECVLKLYAFNIKYFFYDPWNILDFILVAGSLVDNIFMAFQGSVSQHPNINYFRIFRTLRLVKLLARREDMRVLMWTFARSFRALPYVLLLIGIVFFIFAVVGMQMFGKIALNNTGSSIDRNNNFQTFPQAMLLLFRCSTGEAWQDIMISSANKPGVFCDKLAGVDHPECGSNFAYFYFPAFQFICTVMILNILVAIITESFGYLTQDWSLLGPQHLDEFVRLWAEYDPEASGRIRHLDVISLLKRINPPLGIGKLCPRRVARKRLLAMNMPLGVDGTVQFNATLVALIRTALSIHNEGPLDRRNSQLREAVRRIWKKLPETFIDLVIPAVGVNDITIGTFYATSIMQDYYRRKFKK